jgi:multidrug efflux system membrane fusion protein
VKRALLFALLLVACKHDDGKVSAKPAASGGGRGGKAGLTFAVDVMPVESKKIDYVVTATGTIDAFEHVQVTARVAGVVDRVAFTEGQQVKKGDALVVIDSERYQLAVNSAKAQLEKAKANQGDTEAMVTRREGASTEHPGLIPGEELASYRTKSLTAKADTDLAGENLKIAQVNLRDSFVRAPMDGVVQTRTVETGQYVNAGYLMATLLRSDPMLLRFQVEPQDAPRLKPGMIADFTMRETQRAYKAKITLVSGAADPTTHTIGVTGEVVADGHKYWLRPGSFCDVSVDVGATRDAPIVPRSATRATDHGYIAYVVDGDVATEHVITLGMSTKDGWVEVRSGLAAGDQLVVRGGEALVTGAHVRASKVTSVDAGVEAPAAAPAPSDSASAPPAGSARRRGRPDAGKTP